MLTIVSLFPGDSTSLSLKAILPGISMSNKCNFLCVASNSPCGEKSSEVLWYLFVFETYSGMLPPRRYVDVSEARAERAWKVGDCSLVGGDGSNVSAYLGKY